MEALNRGDSAQASQLWLTMSPADRSNLAHGVGFKLQMNKDDVGRDLLRHQQEQAAKDGQDVDQDPDADQATTMNVGDNGETNSQHVEVPSVDSAATVGGLSSLPPPDRPATTVGREMGPQPAAPITEIGPQ